LGLGGAVNPESVQRLAGEVERQLQSRPVNE
jgi:hypothetical protein